MSKLIISAIVPWTVAKLAPEDEYMLGAAIIPNPYGKTLLLIGIEPPEGPNHRIVKKTSPEHKKDLSYAHNPLELSHKDLHEIFLSMLEGDFHRHKGIELGVINKVAALVRTANVESEAAAAVDSPNIAECCNGGIVYALHIGPDGTKHRGDNESGLQRKTIILLIDIDNTTTGSKSRKPVARDGGCPFIQPAGAAGPPSFVSRPGWQWRSRSRARPTARPRGRASERG